MGEEKGFGEAELGHRVEEGDAFKVRTCELGQQSGGRTG